MLYSLLEGHKCTINKKSLTCIKPFLDHVLKVGSNREGGKKGLAIIGQDGKAASCLKCLLNWDHIISVEPIIGLLVRCFLLRGYGAHTA